MKHEKEKLLEEGEEKAMQQAGRVQNERSIDFRKGKLQHLRSIMKKRY